MSRVPTSRSTSGSVAPSVWIVYSPKISGAARKATIVSTVTAAIVTVITTLVAWAPASSSSIEPSSRWCRNDVNSGTSVADSTPPSSSSYTMFGVSLPMR